MRPTRIAAALAVALVVAATGLAASAWGVHPLRVVTGSMAPAIEPGDWIVTRDVGREEPRRGEIVLYRFPLGTEGRAVKRVVAIAGDSVAVDEHRLTVNGRVIPIAGAPGEGAARRRVETVPEGHVFLLGDNAPASIDSRSMGAVPETELVGRVVLVLPKSARRWLLGLAGVLAVAACGLLVGRRRRRARAGA